MLPEKVVTSRTALPSPNTPRKLRRRPGPESESRSPLVSGRSDRMEPLNEFASSSNPVPPVQSSRRTSPECELSS